jgi:hypothetical protein
MYSQLLHNYENVKDDYTLVRKRHDDLVASHSDAVSKLEHSQVSFFFSSFRNLVFLAFFANLTTLAIFETFWHLLHNYENVKDDYTLVRKRHDDLVASHSDAVSKLENSQVS